MTYYKSYYWLIRFWYFAYTISPSPWTYPSSGRYSLAVVAMHLLKLCCSLCCSPEYLQHAFFVLICKIPVFPATCRMWLIRLAALSWRNHPNFVFTLLSTGLFARIVEWSTRPPWSIRPASCITCMHHITQYHTTQASTGYVYTQRNV